MSQMSYTKIAELRNITGAKAKREFIERYKDDPEFVKYLYYSMNPLFTYNVSEKTLRTLVENYKFDEKVHYLSPFSTVFDMCDYLSRLRGIDTATLLQVQTFLCAQCNDIVEQEVCIQLLSKTLRLGVTAKTINKVIPDLIPEWEVQQSYPIEKHPLKPDTEFWLTQKLNGVRATYYNGQLVARSGIPYTGLEHILEEIRPFSHAGLVLDGELTLLDRSGKTDNECFRISTGIINSDDKNADKTGICYTVFDAISVADFESANPNVPYTYRRITLDKISNDLEGTGAKYTTVLPVLYHGKDQSMIDVYLEKMVAEDKEGLMVNTNVPYKRSRHSGILKVKRFYTMDLPITGYEEGTGRLSGTLGSLTLDYEGNEVSVGTGFTDEQRSELWGRRDDLICSLCEVKYKEISRDTKTGLCSLQFPVFVSLREDKSEVSYG